MMLSTTHLLRFFCLLALTVNCMAKELACDATLRFGDEGAMRMHVSLTVQNGQITAVALQRLTEVFSSHTGYTCTATLQRGTPGSAWSRHGSTTRITIAPDESGKPSALVLVARKNGYLLQTHDLPTATCGARVQWPEKVFFPMTGGVCRMFNW